MRPTVYIAGYDYDGSTRTPCYWRNGARYMLPVTAGSDGYTLALTVSGSDVYIAGRERDADYNHTPCYWLNGARYMLPVTAGSDGVAQAVTVSGSGGTDGLPG
jgi:hypothetical protein